MRALTKAATFLAVLLLTACGGDGGPTAPDVLQIGGTWNYQTNNVLVNGITCSISGRTMTITQSGSSFTGQLTGGIAECTAEFGSYSQDLGADGITDGIVNGVIDGNSLSFDLDFDPGASLTGTVSNGAMSGTITERTYSVTGTIVSGTGSWSASR